MYLQNRCFYQRSRLDPAKETSNQPDSLAKFCGCHNHIADTFSKSARRDCSTSWRACCNLSRQQLVDEVGKIAKTIKELQFNSVRDSADSFARFGKSALI
jgi:hypothetical protein